ncbi:hypothetical protein QJS66_13230 [Kocuria rhizophila]|nr:hypothetical protein QJS66_13230 [Kocuria rhizophila]
MAHQPLPDSTTRRDADKDYTAFSRAPSRALMTEHRVVVGLHRQPGTVHRIISAALRTAGHGAHVHPRPAVETHRARGAWRWWYTARTTRRPWRRSPGGGARRRGGLRGRDEHLRPPVRRVRRGRRRVARQLTDEGIAVDQDHPLYVYLPWDRRGSRRGGLRSGAGVRDAVRCVFVEPTQAPCMLLGLHTDSTTASPWRGARTHHPHGRDGLAVGSSLGFAGRCHAGPDRGPRHGVGRADDGPGQLLHASEGIVVEPSAASARRPSAELRGSGRRGGRRTSFERGSRVPEGATHLAWLTGGGMLPADVRARYLG